MMQGLVQRHRGFTLIEMIVVVLIVSILASAAMPLAALHKRRTQEAELRENLRTIRRAIDSYKRAWDAGKLEKKVNESGYPPSLQVLVAGVKDVTQPDDKLIYFLRRLPRDPFAASGVPAEETWGLRSYESPPDQPAPGEDVFDVYSTASGQGLDGTAYASW
jgi:general secretion pathway protein G